MSHPSIGKFKIKLIVIQHDTCHVLVEKLICDVNLSCYDMMWVYDLWYDVGLWCL